MFAVMLLHKALCIRDRDNQFVANIFDFRHRGYSTCNRCDLWSCERAGASLCVGSEMSVCDIVRVRVWRVNLLLTGTVSWESCVTMATTGDKDQGGR